MPCRLLCRPIGESFYVSFADQVPDGSSCELWSSATGTGVEEENGASSVAYGVCINGTCQVLIRTLMSNVDASVHIRSFLLLSILVSLKKSLLSR